MMSNRLKPLVILGFVLPVCTLLLLADETVGELEKEATAIEGLLIAPCCWRQPVSVHYSPAADEIRSEIRKMLKEGRSRQEILDSYIAKYGNRILAKPPAEGFNLLAYFLPVVFLILGAAVAVVVVKKLRPGRGHSPVRKAAKADPKYAERIDRELWG